jgi:hypothetical protein
MVEAKNSVESCNEASAPRIGVPLVPRFAYRELENSTNERGKSERGKQGSAALQEERETDIIKYTIFVKEKLNIYMQLRKERTKHESGMSVSGRRVVIIIQHESENTMKWNAGDERMRMRMQKEAKKKCACE